MSVYKSSYHDTVLDERRREYEASAEALEKMVLEYFRKHPDKDFTPHQVWVALGSRHLLQSVRRAITNLTVGTKKNPETYLFKTGNRRPGGYGSNNCTWQLKQVWTQTKLFE